jgi:hypothetical protein
LEVFDALFGEKYGAVAIGLEVYTDIVVVRGSV